MSELGLYAITVKKYKPHSNKKVKDDLENVLKRDFTTTSINQKWVGDITYIHFYMETKITEMDEVSSYLKVIILSMEDDIYIISPPLKK